MDLPPPPPPPAPWRGAPVRDLVVVGGGVLGLAMALEMRRRHPAASIALIEKEEKCGQHASGRNSGVLHAGFYYTPSSLKARLTRDGNRLLARFCDERGIPVLRCGKLVVAAGAADLEGLGELVRRGRANGIDLEEVTEAQAREIEPRVRTHERALFSPSTSTVDPARVLDALAREASAAGIELLTGTRYLRREGATLVTTRGRLTAGFTINAAGLHADRVARDFGFGERYRILPFKGLYLKSDAAGPLATHVYPVPDLHHPFLGVHFTLTAAGGVKLGPTAIPAFWRENYGGLHGFDAREMAEVLWREGLLFLRNDFGFRKLAFREMAKFRRATMVAQAARLLRDVPPARSWKWAPAGIRAQLYDVTARRLEMDFVFEGDAGSLHVLNAVSPAFTCALSFSAALADEADRLTGGGAAAAGRREPMLSTFTGE